MSDETACQIMDFPATGWSVYDCVQDDFVGVPTFSHLAVSDGDFLIFRPSSFIDYNCIGLNDLVGRTDRKGKRKQNQSPDIDHTSRLSKRMRFKEVLDWTNL